MFSKKQRWQIIIVAIALCFGLFKLSSWLFKTSALTVSESHIENVDYGSALDTYHISFLVKSMNMVKTSVTIRAEIGLNVISGYDSNGSKRTTFQTLGFKDYEFDINPYEQRRITDQLSIEKKEYVKILGAQSVPILKVKIA